MFCSCCFKEFNILLTFGMTWHFVKKLQTNFILSGHTILKFIFAKTYRNKAKTFSRHFIQPLFLFIKIPNPK